jgi:putative ATP-dependent endonuclease of the OLD family
MDILDLERMELDGELVFFPLGGSSLALWTSRLAPLSRPEFHLFDRDNTPPQQPKYQTVADQINQRDRCKAVITGKREMENYLHYVAINEAYEKYDIALGLTAPFADFDDVPSKVAEQVHLVSGSETKWVDLDDKKRAKKVSKAKAILCDTASKMMTKELLGEVDPEGHIVSWFDDMGQLANA